jgi:hypothetical protein
MLVIHFLFDVRNGQVIVMLSTGMRSSRRFEVQLTNPTLKRKRDTTRNSIKEMFK